MCIHVACTSLPGITAVFQTNPKEGIQTGLVKYISCVMSTLVEKTRLVSSWSQGLNHLGQTILEKACMIIMDDVAYLCLRIKRESTIP